MYLQANLIVPLLGATALGVAVTPPAVPSGLLSILSGYGQDVGQTQDAQPCGANETLLTCAENIASLWRVPTSPTCEPQRIQIPITVAPGVLGGYIEPLVHVEASECKLSAPKLMSQGEPFYCSTYSCQKSFSFTTTVTSSHTFGMSTTLTLSLSTAEDVPLVAKFSETFTASEMLQWQDTETVADANTTTTTWTLQNGQYCEPSVVQYSVQCQTTIRIADGATQWPFVKTLSTPDEKDGISTISCDLAGVLLAAPFGSTNNKAFSEFCQALTEDSKETTINVGLSGSPDGIWSLQGCNWPTKPNDPTQLAGS